VDMEQVRYSDIFSACRYVRQVQKYLVADSMNSLDLAYLRSTWLVLTVLCIQVLHNRTGKC